MELGGAESPRSRLATTTSYKPPAPPNGRLPRPERASSEALFLIKTASKFPASSADEPMGVLQHALEVQRTWASSLCHGAGRRRLLAPGCNLPDNEDRILRPFYLDRTCLIQRPIMN